MEIAVSIVRREGELAREVCAIVREKRGDSRGESMYGVKEMKWRAWRTE